MKPKLFITMLVSLLLAPSVYASKESAVRKGNALYKKGDFDSSLKNYEDALKIAPESPEVNFNLGTALYKSKKYNDAIPYLQKGLLSSAPDVKKNAHFNLGDALFAAGLEVEKQNLTDAVKSLEESVRQFDAVVNLDDKDKDAQYNQDIVKKELARLKKQQEQQQQKQGNDQKQNQNQEQQENKKESEQNKSSSAENKEASSSEEKTGQQNSQPGNNGDDKKPPFKPEGQSSDDKGGQDQQKQGQQVVPGEMSQEEAKDLLKQFEQNEQPAGLLNFGKKKMNDRPVSKDW